VIRADLPCKAYLDVEGEKGALIRESGRTLLDATLRHWTAAIESCWPECFEKCPKAKEAVVLDGSRLTSDGWKVSYHIVFPWLSFQRNDGTLKDLVRKLSEIPDLQYLSKGGTTKPFVDCNVYTKMRQFRTVLSWKLDDRTCTGFRIVGSENEERLLQSFVTRLEVESWKIPETSGLTNSGSRRRSPWRSSGVGVNGRAADIPRRQSGVIGLLGNIRQLLEQNDQPPGRLTYYQGRTFRWDAKKRPCLFALQ